MLTGVIPTSAAISAVAATGCCAVASCCALLTFASAVACSCSAGTLSACLGLPALTGSGVGAAACIVSPAPAGQVGVAGCSIGVNGVKGSPTVSDANDAGNSSGGWARVVRFGAIWPWPFRPSELTYQHLRPVA